MEKGKNVNRLLSLVLVSALTAGSLPLNQVKAIEVDPNTNDIKTEDNQKQEEASKTETEEVTPKKETVDNSNGTETTENTTDKETKAKQQEGEVTPNQSLQTFGLEANGETRAIKDLKLKDGSVVLTKSLLGKGWPAIKAEIEKQMVENPGVASAEDIVWVYSLTTPAFLGWKEIENNLASFTALENGTYKIGVKVNSVKYISADITLTTSYLVDFQPSVSHGTVKVNNNVTTSEKVVPEDKLTFTVTPDSGYKVDTVSVGNTPITANTDGSYTISKVDSNKTVTATYKEIDNTRTVTINKMGEGNVVDENGKKIQFTNNSATVKLEKGKSASFKFVPEANTYVKSVNGVETKIEEFGTDRSYAYTVTDSQVQFRVEFGTAALKAKSDKSINYFDKLSNSIIEKNVYEILDSANSVPSNLVQNDLKIEYKSRDAVIFVWDELWKPVIESGNNLQAGEHVFGKNILGTATSTEKVRIKYAGDSKYPALTLETSVELKDNRIETNIILNDNIKIKYDTVENMQNQIYNTVVNSVTSGNTTLNPKPAFTDFKIDFTRALDTQEVTVTYKGNDTYKTSTNKINVTVMKGDATVAVQSQNIVYGEAFKNPVITTNPVDADAISVIAGIDGNAQGFASVMIPERIKNLLNVTILGVNPYEKIKGMFNGDAGLSIGELKATIDKLKKDELIGIIQTIIPDFDIIGSLNGVLVILEDLDIPDDIALRIYLEKTPDQAGLYLVGAVTTSVNYNTAIGVGYLTIAPKTANVTLAFDSAFGNKHNILPYSEKDSFDFGGHIVDEGINFDTNNIRTQYAGFSFDGEFHTNTKPILEPGVYTETIYVLGGNYFATPITRAYTIKKQDIKVLFDQLLVIANYDGKGHGLTANVYEDGKLTDKVAELTYTRLNSDAYQSTTQPVDAGVYNVTATYKGDGTDKPITNSLGTLIINKSIKVGVVNVGNLTTTYGDTTDLTKVDVTTKNLADRDVTTIKNTIHCETADVIGSHKISVDVPASIQRNYLHPVVVKDGTHTINPKEVTIAVTGGDEKDGTYYKRFGDKDPIYSYAIEGLVNGETNEDFGSVTLERAEGEHAGKYDITPAIKQANGNYKVKETKTGTLNILKRPITISAEDVTKTYDGKEAVGEYTISGLPANMSTMDAEELGLSLKTITTHVVDGETVTFEGMPTEAGKYTVTYALDTEKPEVRSENTMGDNFEVTFISFNVTINARPITIDANDVTKTYDGKAATADYTITGLAEGMSATTAEELGMSLKVITTQVVDGKTITTDGFPTDAGKYTVTYALGDKVNSNYAVTFQSFNVTINARPITIGAKDITKTYDGKATSADYTITGLPEGMTATTVEELGMSLKLITKQVIGGKTTTIEGLPKNAGDYTLTYALGDKVNKNYAVTCNPFNVKINKANVVVTPEFGQNKVIGTKDTALKYVVRGNVAGEIIDVTLTRVAGEAVGLYNYVLTVNKNAVNDNYNIILGEEVNSKFEILAKAVVETPKEEDNEVKKDDGKPATGDVTNAAGTTMTIVAAGACMASILRRRRKNTK